MATRMEEAGPRAFEPGMQNEVGAATVTPGWDLATERRIDDGETLARALGWFSIGLGVAELVATEPLCRSLGMEEKEGLVRLYGLREIAKGVGILRNRRPQGWIYARIAGGVLDLATLAPGLTRENRKRDNVMLAVAAVAGVTVLDVICARQLSADRYEPGTPSERAARSAPITRGDR